MYIENIQANIIMVLKMRICIRKYYKFISKWKYLSNLKFKLLKYSQKILTNINLSYVYRKDTGNKIGRI